MRSRKISIFCFLFLFAFALMANSSAEAHFLSIITDSSTAEVGKVHEVGLSFTHVLPGTAQFGAQYPEIYASDIDFDAKYLYNDNTATSFGAFSESPVMNVSSAKLEKKGTVLLFATCDMTMFGNAPDGFPVTPIPVKTFSKQILNAASDGWSTHEVGPGDYLEIVPQSDLAGAKVGDTIKFKAILNGSALAGATVEWADPASELYEDPEEGGDANLQDLPAPTGADGVFSYTITHAGLNAVAIAHESYTGSLIFGAGEATVGDGGGSGCNSGFGFASLIGLSGVFAFLSRKRRG
jgi:hypothetical protein